MGKILNRVLGLQGKIQKPAQFLGGNLDGNHVKGGRGEGGKPREPHI